jgi:hypothetical protein
LTKTLDTREDAAVILSGIEKIKFIALLFLWSEVLSCIDRIQTVFRLKKQLFIKH